MKKYQRVLSILLAILLLTAAVSCQKEVTAEDLMANIEAGNASEVELDENFCRSYSSTAFTMLKNEYSADGGNVVLSPLGAFYNLALIANGAASQNKTELEKMLGRKYETDAMNGFMHTFSENLKDSDFAKLYFKNALWFNSSKNVAPANDFLANAKTFYGAAAYREAFGSGAVTNINNWASNETDMFAEYVIKDIPADAPVYAINTTVLDAKWSAPISPENVMDGVFTNASSQEESVQVMSTYESVYVGNELVEGFIKKYSGGNYAFLAVKPKKNSNSSLVDAIYYFTNGTYYCDMVKNRKSRTIDASIPKFSCEYTGGVKDMLDGLNLGFSFNPTHAGLSGIGTADGNIYLGDIVVSTGLSVTETGTSKGTGAKVGDPAGATDVTSISLDGPFIFAVVETQNYMPVILGAINTVKG